MPSREMAWSRRGAPVRLCSPAPQVEKKEPMTMTQGDGQARVPTTRLPFTASPNLERDSEGTETLGEQCYHRRRAQKHADCRSWLLCDLEHITDPLL